MLKNQRNIRKNRISEFNYKLRHGILNNNLCVNKWNKAVSPLCEVFNVNEDIKLLLQDSKIVKHFWETISNSIKFDTTWKTIVFTKKLARQFPFFNNFLFISFTIHKYKMKCRIHRERICQQDLRHKLKDTPFPQNGHVIITSIGNNKNDFYDNVGNSRLFQNSF